MFAIVDLGCCCVDLLCCVKTLIQKRFDKTVCKSVGDEDLMIIICYPIKEC